MSGSAIKDLRKQALRYTPQGHQLSKKAWRLLKKKYSELPQGDARTNFDVGMALLDIGRTLETKEQLEEMRAKRGAALQRMRAKAADAAAKTITTNGNGHDWYPDDCEKTKRTFWQKTKSLVTGKGWQ